MKLHPAQLPFNHRTRIALVVEIIRWPFTSPKAAPLWFALRLYIGWIFFQFSMTKFSSGWLTSDPVGGLLKHVAAGRIPVPLAFYRDVAGAMIDAGITPLISFLMPFAELAVALAMVSGILLLPAVLGGILLLLNTMLSGIGAVALDGRIIVGLLLIGLAWQVADRIGAIALLTWLRGFAPGSLRLAPQPARVRSVRRQK